MGRCGYSARATVCAGCGHYFWYGEMMYLNKYGQCICQKCSEREHMETKNLEITVKLNGKEVPLNTISAGTFEAIKALEKPKEIPVARVGHYKNAPDERRLFLKITDSIRQNVARTSVDVIAINLKNGDVNNIWQNDKEADGLSLYENIRPL